MNAAGRRLVRAGAASRAAVLALAGAPLLAAGGCHRGGESIADAAPPPSLGAEVPDASERVLDELWRRAGEGDALDLARLADREGAAGLLEGFEEGGVLARTALAALPFADDGEVAYGRLAEVVRQLARADAVAPLVAIGGIAARPREQREPLDPVGRRAAGDAVLAVAKDVDAPREARVAAVSAARALAEHGAVDKAAIPTDVDR